MTKDGKIEWVRYDEKDEATHPRPGQELLIMALNENSYLRERCSQTREHPRFLFT